MVTYLGLDMLSHVVPLSRYFVACCYTISLKGYTFGKVINCCARIPDMQVLAKKYKCSRQGKLEWDNATVQG